MLAKLKISLFSPLPFSRLFYRVKVVASSRAGKYSSEISQIIICIIIVAVISNSFVSLLILVYYPNKSQQSRLVASNVASDLTPFPFGRFGFGLSFKQQCTDLLTAQAARKHLPSEPTIWAAPTTYHLGCEKAHTIWAFIELRVWRL